MKNVICNSHKWYMNLLFTVHVSTITSRKRKKKKTRETRNAAAAVTWNPNIANGTCVDLFNGTVEPVTYLTWTLLFLLVVNRDLNDKYKRVTLQNSIGWRKILVWKKSYILLKKKKIRGTCGVYKFILVSCNILFGWRRRLTQLTVIFL